MRTFVAIHTHRFGVSVHPFKCDELPYHFEVVAACHIDFEPDREESIELHEVEFDKAPTIE